jgi:two-component system alkaline phosphatase synthesis response regulator PhoP
MYLILYCKEVNMPKISALLITNSTALCKMTSNFLGEKGIDVRNCTDEDDYIKRIQRNQPDLVIIDADTEAIKAEAICKDIKRRFPRVFQIAVTKSEEAAHIKKFIKVPVDDFVVKPVSPSILYLRIKNIFKDHMKDKEILKNGDLEIDNVKKQVFLNGVQIEVSPKEFRLLRYLVENKGRVLSRNAILNHVWGYDSYVIDRNVDVYVGYIRKKLEGKKKSEYIKTVPSFGYMMKNLS